MPSGKFGGFASRETDVHHVHKTLSQLFSLVNCKKGTIIEIEEKRRKAKSLENTEIVVLLVKSE
jgi:hypothetical protein